MQILEKQKTYKEILEEIFRDSLKERLGRYLTLNEVLCRQSKDLIIGILLKAGQISIPYVMRKFKCTHDEAKEKIKNATLHHCRSLDAKVINYFDAEFNACDCFR